MKALDLLRKLIAYILDIIGYLRCRNVSVNLHIFGLDNM